MGNFNFLIQWAILQFGRFYILGDFGVGDSGVGDFEFFNRMGDFAVIKVDKNIPTSPSTYYIVLQKGN